MRKVDDKKTILFVLHEGRRTGAIVYAEKIIRFLQANRQQYRVVVHVAQDGEVIKSLHDAGVCLMRTNQKTKHTVRMKHFYYRVRYYLKFACHLLLLRPHLVYSNTITNAGEVILAKLFLAKTVVHAHEGMSIARKILYPLRLSAKFTDRYIAVSNYSAAVLNATIKRSSTVIHNGIDSTAFVRIGPAASQLHTIGVVGIIERNKGQLLAVKALNILVNERKINLLIKIIGTIGDTEYFDEIEEYISSHDLRENVAMLGPVTGEANIYSGLDCTVSTSYDEAFPLVSLESMASGRLLIASSTGGNMELIEDGVTGLLFPIGDFQSLADTIDRIVWDAELRSQIEKRAQETVKRRFQLADKLELIAAQISELLDQK